MRHVVSKPRRTRLFLKSSAHTSRRTVWGACLKLPANKTMKILMFIVFCIGAGIIVFNSYIGGIVTTLVVIGGVLYIFSKDG